jgi:gas vesicle protein
MWREPHVSEDTEDLHDQSSSRIAWFITGAVIGAVAAILYAPKSGKDTRQYIADRTQQSCDAVNETSKDILEAGREMFDRGRKLVEDAAELFERGRKLVKG